MVFPVSLNRLGFQGDHTRERQHVIPLEDKQEVVGLVIDNETDKDLWIYSPILGVALDKALRVSSGHVRRLEFDAGGRKDLPIMLHFDESPIGRYWVERE